MKFGFEVEAFCESAINNQLVLVPKGLPFDECGWLLEVRSEPHTNIRKAIALLQVELQVVKELASKAGVVPIFEPLHEVPRDLKVKAARQFGKGIISYRNVYGFETHRNPTKFQTASLHISFTDERTFKHDKGVFTYPGFVDHAKLIFGLDKAFKEEIKKAKRNPGFYEVKSDGRIEYRSLPNNVDLDKLQQVLTDLCS